jgi:uncharacterized membrane protein YfcA
MRCGMTKANNPLCTRFGVVNFTKASSSRFSSPCRSSSYCGLSHKSVIDSSVRAQLSLPAMAVGLWAGLRLDRRLDPAAFRKLVVGLRVVLSGRMVIGVLWG